MSGLPLLVLFSSPLGLSATYTRVHKGRSQIVRKSNRAAKSTFKKEKIKVSAYGHLPSIEKVLIPKIPNKGFGDVLIQGNIGSRKAKIKTRLKYNLKKWLTLKM